MKQMPACRWLLFFLVSASTLLLAGCGDPGPQRYDVSGTVTYKGRPLPAGLIRFDPDFTKGHDGPQGWAHIKEGRFDTAPTESGPTAGPHVARIDGFDGKPGEELPMGHVLFTDFEESVEVPEAASTHDFDIPGR